MSIHLAIYIIVASLQNDIPPQTTFDIIQCESRWDIDTENPNSTASGLYQFLDGTHEAYCEGEKNDPYKQTDCFVKLYPKFPQWWECSKLI